MGSETRIYHTGEAPKAYESGSKGGNSGSDIPIQGRHQHERRLTARVLKRRCCRKYSLSPHSSKAHDSKVQENRRNASKGWREIDRNC